MYNDTFNIFQRWTALLPLGGRIPYWENQGLHCDTSFSPCIKLQNTFVLLWSFIHDWKDYEGRSWSQILSPLLPEIFLICFGSCHYLHADKQKWIVNIPDHFDRLQTEWVKHCFSASCARIRKIMGRAALLGEAWLSILLTAPTDIHWMILALMLILVHMKNSSLAC